MNCVLLIRKLEKLETKKKSTGLQGDTVRRLYIFFPNTFA